MKFTQSERVLHQIDYNPPCNYYNPTQKHNKDILNGTLAGAVLIKKDKNTFGFNKRFQNAQEKFHLPGPGEYFMDKKEIVYQFSKDLSKPKMFLKNTFRNHQPSPSIPYKVLDKSNLDEEDKKFLKELALLEDVNRASGKIHKKQPSYSFSKSPRNILPCLEKQKSNLSHQDSQFPNSYTQLMKIQQDRVISTVINKKQKQTSKNNIIINETIKKSTKKRNQNINNIGPDFVPSLELIQLMKKMRSKQNPGPGAYELKKNQSFSSLIQNEETINNQKGIKFTTVKRFQSEKKNLVGPGTYTFTSDFVSKKGFQISKEKRALFNLKQNKDLCHRFYIDPNSQSKNTIQTLFGQSQRSNSCHILKKRTFAENEQILGGFGSSSKRFSVASTSYGQQDKKSVLSQFEQKKKQQFKQVLKNKMKKLHSQDRYSTKEDSGLLGISSMAMNFQ